MRKIILISLLGILMSLSWGSSAWGVSEAGVLFLRLPAGARAAGMGEAFIAISDDATATHWNPAGLGKYPLSSEWLEYHPGPGYQIKSIALKKNDLPEKNYMVYDIWAITSTDLLYWNGEEWIVSLDGPLPIRALVEAADGTLWAGGVLDGIHMLKK